MSKATKTVDGVVSIDLDAVNSATVAVFVAEFKARSKSFLNEAIAYVAAVDARGGKRGSDAEVQRIIAAGLPTGAKPYSPARYSKLAASFRALEPAGFPAGHAEGFEALRSLWDVSSDKLSATERDDVVKAAARRKSDETRVQFIWSKIDEAKAGKSTDKSEQGGDESDESGNGDESVEQGADNGAISLEVLLTVVQSVTAAALDLSDAERVQLADALQKSADSVWEITSNLAAVAETVAA